MVNAKEIVKKLEHIKGLYHINLINEEDKDIINNLEEENNLGVLECLDRKHVVMVTHDSNFRKPEGSIVNNNGKGISFPPVSFSEVEAKNVVSSSPTVKVHDYLMKRFELNVDEEHATLLIGFDL
jgi:hypothetical protein|tara:strand:- start:7336 stop:7710 length:375 start_codon:yes stop_codon:yes gene_type:complete